MGTKHLGIDIGSTTIKLVVLDEDKKILFTEYKRHFSDIKKAITELIADIDSKLSGNKVRIKVTGSGGLGIAKWLDLEFVQEVIACSYAVKEFIPQTDVAIELGGEDAKLTYFEETIDQKMNGSCAGGTGAFIDQMAVLLDTDANGLNELAKGYEKIYPIAARCGVFAKTDIQPLINEGVSKSDIAASIYQAVVNQTISGLAMGKPIVGNVAFLGGPLSFSSELRKRFIETLQLSESEVESPENAKLFVAIGAALYASLSPEILFDDFSYKALNSTMPQDEGSVYLDALFDEEETYEQFKNRHSNAVVEREDVNKYVGNAYLGIDAGSTTSKLVLISEAKKILYYEYKNNVGDPLNTIKTMISKMYENINTENITIKSGYSTGYGENLIKSAFKLDGGEIETICHYKAAAHFNPNVDFILDIGGQDMKCMRIKNGIIYDIMLNEACSSGCGSFIEGFATTLGVSIEEFVKLGVQSKNPVELGSRCTVFMNSKVKQAQKEGAEISDISAGLAYSVIKNALNKVIKINDFSTIGENLVVQGGTFYNDAVLKAFEKTVGKNAIRPDISGLMGAFGAAIVAIENSTSDISQILNKHAVNELSYSKRNIRCNLCENNCSMTLNLFNDGSKFIIGNKCEKGAGVSDASNVLPNIYTYKYERIFDYKSLTIEEAKYGEIGIPRVLNIYEHYPFWHTFFTKLGFSVKLSPRSNKKLYELGMDTITSDTMCYPAKIVNGHIKSLVDSGIKTLFYPCLPYENKSREKADKNYNCPVVISYPEVISNNLDLKEVNYIAPFLPMDNIDVMKTNLVKALSDFEINEEDIKEALEVADQELSNYKQDVRNQGEKILKYMEEHDKKGIVLAGRPYHIDPEINHGLEKIITELGMVVLSEDSVAHLSKDELDLRVLDQWSFHSRLYLAADYVTKNENLEMVQLTSFGCGIDAIVSEQVSEVLRKKGKNYSLIKIDEGSNLGAIRIRIRSIQAAMIEREKSGEKLPIENISYNTPSFTEEMKKNHTLLVPQMSPLHFRFVSTAFKQAGYNAVVLPSVDSKAIDIGTKYVNNDSCYPAIIVIGQIISALQSGKYDLNNVSVMISQTGGGCRASNYLAQLKKAMKEAGYPHIPIVSFNLVGLEKNPGFKITPMFILTTMMSALYGDLLMRLSNRTRPYEKNKGETDKLLDSWVDKIIAKKVPSNYFKYKAIVKQVINDFSNIELHNKSLPKVGVVGEILVKYHPTGNNELFKTVENEGAELVVPDLVDFVLYSAYNNIYNYENLGRSKKAATNSKLLIKGIDFYRSYPNKLLQKTGIFTPSTTIYNKIAALKGVVSVGNQTGEGWFLTAEMMEMLSHGVSNIIAVQPFGCLPNHIFAKSVIKPIKKHFPKANIVAIDYDPGISAVNQLNRIKLMLEMSSDSKII
ncbi:MAG: acyl-CoA dehydratase activase-related protein [Bacilli bacterium]